MLANQDGRAREAFRQVAFVDAAGPWLAWKSAGRASALLPAGTGNGAAELAAPRQDADRERVKVAPAALEARDPGVSFGNVRAGAGLSLTPRSNRCLSREPASSATARRAVRDSPQWCA